MHKLLFGIVFLLSLALCSCFNSQEHKTKRLIKEYLKENLYDWKSYSSINYSAIAAGYSTFYEDQLYINIEQAIQYLNDESNKYLSDAEGFAEKELPNMTKSFIKKAQEDVEIKFEYEEKIDSIKRHYVPQYKGLVMNHEFWAKNKLGKKQKHHYRFYFNNELTTIIDVKDISIDNYAK